MRLIELTVGVLDRYVRRLAVDHASRSRRGKVGLPPAAQQIAQGLVVIWRCC
ncbi:hypothetical protein SAMN06296378_0489 [Salinibacterium xinjiangense]|uniref:Uncharacterized protein n=1 Tax=Salinibacterium xinjiangense TaxID=386302 RepID=A0A2C8YR89_9MICO|nr:hypothetical protein [Salinibacterium xinjiangense]SOE52996.1 hypothetical protein SAMN06296378_0489 [Salinibacterium xinjiangense]